MWRKSAPDRVPPARWRGPAAGGSVVVVVAVLAAGLGGSELAGSHIDQHGMHPVLARHRDGDGGFAVLALQPGIDRGAAGGLLGQGDRLSDHPVGRPAGENEDGM